MLDWKVKCSLFYKDGGWEFEDTPVLLEEGDKELNVVFEEKGRFYIYVDDSTKVEKARKTLKNMALTRLQDQIDIKDREAMELERQRLTLDVTAVMA